MAVSTRLLQIALLEEDQETVDAQMRALSGKPYEVVGAIYLMSAALAHGRVRAKRELLAQWTPVAAFHKMQDAIQRFELESLPWYGDIGDCQAIRGKNIPRGATDAETWNVAVALAECGDPGRARTIARNFKEGDDEMSNLAILPSIQALIEINAGDPAKAVGMLEPARD